MIHLAQLIDQVNKSVKLKNPADKYTICPPEEYMGEHTEIGCDEYSNVLNTERNYYATKSITTESEFADKSNIRQLCRTPNDLQSIFKPYTLKINDRNGLGTDESSVFQSLENPIDNIKEIEIIENIKTKKRNNNKRNIPIIKLDKYLTPTVDIK